MCYNYKKDLFLIDSCYYFTHSGGIILNTESNASASNKRKQSGSSFYEWFDSIIRALVIILIILTFFFKVCTVVGDSMNNTLYDQERLVISNFLYTPKVNDVIVFHQTGILNEPCVKRVISTGNKWVKIDFDSALLYVSNDNIFTEDDLVDESYYAYFDIGKYKQKGSLETFVPDGYLFVMGDNRNNSTDSRYDAIGLVDEKTVLGKVILRISPSDRMGFIK